MRSSKKRKLVGIETKPVNVLVSKDARDKLDKMAGPIGLGEMVETLIEREYSRRERRQQSLQVANSSCS